MNSTFANYTAKFEDLTWAPTGKYACSLVELNTLELAFLKAVHFNLLVKDDRKMLALQGEILADGVGKMPKSSSGDACTPRDEIRKSTRHAVKVL